VQAAVTACTCRKLGKDGQQPTPAPTGNAQVKLGVTIAGHRRERFLHAAVPGGQLAEEFHGLPHRGLDPTVTTLTRTPFLACWHSMAAIFESSRTAALAEP
jgi:hypothetical protein